jgi:WD40 repeat protein
VGCYAVSVDFAGGFFVWHLTDGTEVKPKPPEAIPPGDGVFPHFLWNNHAHVAFPRGNNDVRVWNKDTQRETLRCVGHTQPIHCIDYQPRDRRLLTGSEDHTLRVWDLDKGTEITTFVHSDWVLCAVFSANGKLVLSGSRDKKVRLWQL